MPAEPSVTTATETLRQSEVLAFFAALEGCMGALYPGESNHFVAATGGLALRVIVSRGVVGGVSRL
jgi:hypothetical protein